MYEKGKWQDECMECDWVGKGGIDHSEETGHIVLSKLLGFDGTTEV